MVLSSHSGSVIEQSRSKDNNKWNGRTSGYGSRSSDDMKFWQGYYPRRLVLCIPILSCSHWRGDASYDETGDTCSCIHNSQSTAASATQAWTLVENVTCKAMSTTTSTRLNARTSFRSQCNNNWNHARCYQRQAISARSPASKFQTRL